jgi:hypothetical protein
MADSPAAGRRLLLAIAAMMMVGLALRIAAAQGALWLDEAWSAVTAHDVGTPMRVFLTINHDNNHHLNTLWLQLVGLGAPPLLQRALSIATGTAAILVAALIGARQGKGAAACAALLFAVSPLLVTYGAEARGYAPMVLALLVTVLLAMRWLDHPETRVPAVPLCIAVLLGMLSQLTMAFGLAAIGLWATVALLRSRPPRAALHDLARLMLPILLAVIAVLATLFGAAWAAGTGIRLGNHEAFSLGAFTNGVGAMLLAAAGGPAALVAALLLTLPGDQPERNAGRARDKLLLLTLAAIPLGVALVRLANSGAPRYHLLCGIAVLLLVAIRTGARVAPGHALRWPAGALLLLIVAASLITDFRLVANRRADPGRALDAIVARAPAGAAVAVERGRATAVLRAAGESRPYPLTIVEAPCPAARFLFMDRDGDAPFPAAPERCGSRYRPIAEGHPTGLSGTHWKLYERLR